MNPARLTMLKRWESLKFNDYVKYSVITVVCLAFGVTSNSIGDSELRLGEGNVFQQGNVHSSKKVLRHEMTWNDDAVGEFISSQQREGKTFKFK